MIKSVVLPFFIAMIVLFNVVLKPGFGSGDNKDVKAEVARSMEINMNLYLGSMDILRKYKNQEMTAEYVFQKNDELLNIVNKNNSEQNKRVL